MNVILAITAWISCTKHKKTDCNALSNSRWQCKCTSFISSWLLICNACSQKVRHCYFLNISIKIKPILKNNTRNPEYIWRIWRDVRDYEFVHHIWKMSPHHLVKCRCLSSVRLRSYITIPLKGVVCKTAGGYALRQKLDLISGKQHHENC